MWPPFFNRDLWLMGLGRCGFYEDPMANSVSYLLDALELSLRRFWRIQDLNLPTP
jgi:hypothetical protein